ncbi:hypothetical protein [Symbiobacterium terraclitae]|uniref:hypothetical protein n=1 Tax=Symbiobacterium terraclitae TaxID=557451 RepID=UPI0035B56B18
MSIRDMSTPEARAIWEVVDRPGRELPPWMKQHVRAVVADCVAPFRQRMEAGRDPDRR